MFGRPTNRTHVVIQGAGPDIAAFEAAERGLSFGADVSIGPGSMIRPSSYYGGEVGEGLVMGDRSSMGAGCFIGCSGSKSLFTVLSTILRS